MINPTHDASTGNRPSLLQRLLTIFDSMAAAGSWAETDDLIGRVAKLERRMDAYEERSAAR